MAIFFISDNLTPAISEATSQALLDPSHLRVQALNTYGFDKLFSSFYNEVNDVFTSQTLYVQNSDVDPSGTMGVNVADNVSAGGTFSTTVPRGVICRGPSPITGDYYTDTARYIGEGGVGVMMNFDNIDMMTKRIVNLNYYDTSHGAWWINGSLWAIMGVVDYAPVFGSRNLQLIACESVGLSGASWHAYLGPILHDVSTAQIYAGAALRYDNGTKLDLYAPVDNFTSTNYCLRQFDFVTKTWSAPFAIIPRDPTVPPWFANNDTADLSNEPSDFGNGIYRFPNGDYIICYAHHAAGTLDAPIPGNLKVIFYYAATSSWSAEINVRTAHAVNAGGVWYVRMSPPQLVPDPACQSVHIFSYDTGAVPGPGGVGHVGVEYGYYDIVKHDGTVINDCYFFPTRYGTDGFGHGVTDKGYIYVPFDTFSVPIGAPGGPANVGENNIFRGLITGGATTFKSYLISRPQVEIGVTPSCTFLITLPQPSCPTSIPLFVDQAAVTLTEQAKLFAGVSPCSKLVDSTLSNSINYQF